MVVAAFFLSQFVFWWFLKPGNALTRNYSHLLSLTVLNELFLTCPAGVTDPWDHIVAGAWLFLTIIIVTLWGWLSFTDPSVGSGESSHFPISRLQPWS